jgi:hypothetical protein
MTVSPKGRRRINLPVGFKTIFLVVVLLTVAAFLINIYLAPNDFSRQTLKNDTLRPTASLSGWRQGHHEATVV